MNICIANLHDASYQPLADLTWEPNKVAYAEQHDYWHCEKTSGFYGVPLGWEKLRFLKDTLTTNTELDWIWWVGCDTMITNFNKKVEDVLDNNYHMIVAQDCLGINNDSMFVRNSPEGLGYLDYLISVMPQYMHHHWQDQQAMIESVDRFKDIIKFIPQKLINAYDYELYPQQPPHSLKLDALGNYGQWEPGDLIIQWPGLPVHQKIEQAKKYANLVQR